MYNIMIFYLLSAVCGMYFLMVALYTGLNSKFHLIWLFFAVALFLFGRLYNLNKAEKIHIPQRVSGLCGAFCFCLLLIFLMIVFQIISYGARKPETGAEYMIVLGAQVNGRTVSKSLGDRLDAAYEYYRNNPETKIIVSGARGSGEEITEAQAMKEYLLQEGVAGEQIICEENSVNTDQNIAFSRRLIGSNDARTIIVTNRFHLYRAVRIAKKQGMTQVEGLAAKDTAFMMPSYYLRETLAVLSYRLTGRI